MRQILLLNIISLLLLTGGGSNTSYSENKSKSAVSMIVAPSNIKSSQVDYIKLILKNSGKDSLKLNDKFSIDFYNGSSWKSLPVFRDVLFNDIAYIIPPRGTKELFINLKPNQLIIN